MKEYEVLDRFTVELRISPAATEEVQRDTLRRLDESPLFAHLQAGLQQALNAADMDDVQAIVKR